MMTSLGGLGVAVCLMLVTAGCGAEPASEPGPATQESSPTPVESTPPITKVDGPAGIPKGWTTLDPLPEVRTGAATAWTGTELLIWGGYVYTGLSDEEPTASGFALDPVSGDWKELPPAPIGARAFAASAWTGSELLVWGGWNLHHDYFGDGAAYDPAAGTWRSLPAAPIDARVPLSAWTGEKLIVWGTGVRTQTRPLDGAAYDPASDTWRSIAEGPIELTDATAAWTGTEMIVFGAALHGGNHAESQTAIGAAYDPTADTWREMSDSNSMSPNANTAVWADGTLIALDYDSEAEAYDPRTDRWSQLPGMPLHQGEDVPAAAYADGSLLTTFFGQVAAFSAASQRWTDYTRAIPNGLSPDPPIVAGDTFLVPATPVTGDGQGALLAFRPSS